MDVARFLGVWNWSQSLSTAKDLKVIASFWLSITKIFLRNCASSSPAQLRTAAAWIGAKFLSSSAHDFVCDLTVRAGAFPGLERFLHAAIFAGVKREDGDPAAGIQAERKTLQQYIQRAKFVIHCDPQRLEDSAHGIFVSPSAANDCGKLHRRRN